MQIGRLFRRYPRGAELRTHEGAGQASTLPGGSEAEIPFSNDLTVHRFRWRGTGDVAEPGGFADRFFFAARGEFWVVFLMDSAYPIPLSEKRGRQSSRS